MGITWLGILAAVILIFMGAMGYRRGFIREIVSFFFVFLAIALAGAMNPYVNDFLMEKTPLYGMIQTSCEDLVAKQVTGGSGGSGSDQAGTSGTDTAGADAAVADVAETNTAGAGASGESEFSGASGSGGQSQNALIQALGLPSTLNQSLESNNTAEVYSALAVSTFGEYVSGYLAKTILKGLSFLLSYILASVVLRLIAFLLNMIARLPLIRGANRLLGGLVGVAKGLLFIWIGLLVLTVLCSTEIGKEALQLVEKDAVLSLLYKYDVFVNLIF